MYEVTCFHCGHVANISPDVERCAVCGEDLRHLITPDYSSRYFYDRAAQMAAAGEVTLALLEVERGIAYRTSSELYLLAAILAQRLGDQAQVRRYVSAIPVDDVLRPEAEWLLRSQQPAIRSVRETRAAAYAAANRPPASPTWLADTAPLPATQRPSAVRLNPLLYGIVAIGLVLLVLWLTFGPIATAVGQLWRRNGDLAQVTPTSAASLAATPMTPATDSNGDAALPSPTPSITGTPAIPLDLVQPAGTPEPVAASSPISPAGGSQFDLKGYLAITNRPELAELAIGARLDGTTLKLQGTVSLYDHRQSVIELAQRAPNVTAVDAVNLLLRLPATYTVQSGDSLWLISYKLYGADRVADLFAANREVLPSAEALSVGQTLQVPPNP